MLIQEVPTPLPAAEVIRRAREFFAHQNSPYAAFVDSASDTHIRLRFDAGSMAIGVAEREGRTVVRGSTSRLHAELSEFLASLTHFPEDVRQNALGAGNSGAG